MRLVIQGNGRTVRNGVEEIAGAYEWRNAISSLRSEIQSLKKTQRLAGVACREEMNAWAQKPESA